MNVLSTTNLGNFQNSGHFEKDSKHNGTSISDYATLKVVQKYVP